MLKNYFRQKLKKLVKQYFVAHPEVKLIAIAGSVSKTTTKHAVSTILSQRYRVGGALDDRNYDPEISVPFGILGLKIPEKLSSFSDWRKVFKAAKTRVKQPATVDVIVQDFSIAKPGDMANFGTYLSPDITILTAITPEHMEFFGNMETVASEEAMAVNFAKAAFVNRDDVNGNYARYISNQAIMTYGATQIAENRIEVSGFSTETGFTGRFVGTRVPQGFDLAVRVFGEQVLRAVTVAIAIGLEFGMSVLEIQEALKKVSPVLGRMNVLRGRKNSLLIDDTYTSSPAAVREALRALYRFPISAEGYKIAVLGSMNQLGALSAEAHREIGGLCDPSQLEWVVTVGQEANQYLAPVARARGCQVKSFATALEAGGFVNKVLRPGSVVLFNGSQDGIYLEEAAKLVLASAVDYDKLIRQSLDWQKTKGNFFATQMNLTEGDD